MTSMSLRHLLSGTLLLTLVAFAHAEALAPGPTVVRVGAAITTKKPTHIDKLAESVLLPKDCAGRKITVQGVVTMIPPKDAEAHAHPHDEAMAEGHACPTPSYLISTQGAELIAPKKK